MPPRFSPLSSLTAPPPLPGPEASRISRIAAIAMLAAGLAVVVITVGAVLRLHVILPVWDEWITTLDYARLEAGAYGLGDLAAQYNEHRILIPRLLYFVDDALFDMTGWFNLAVMFLAQAANAAMLVGLMARLVANRSSRLFLAGVVLVLMFSLRQEQNFTFGFQLQFTGVFTLAMAAILAFVGGLDQRGDLEARGGPEHDRIVGIADRSGALAPSPHRGRWTGAAGTDGVFLPRSPPPTPLRGATSPVTGGGSLSEASSSEMRSPREKIIRLLLAALFCTAATYTMANGVLAAPTLLVLALLVRAPWRVTVGAAAVAVVLAALYFHGFVRNSLDLPLDVALAHPLAAPRFVAALMGNVLGSGLKTTQAFGLLGLAGAALAAVAVATRRRPEPASAALVGIMGFVIASACAETYGRLSVGIEQAYEGRYVEPTAIFWCALIVFWTPSAIRRVPRPGAICLAGRVALGLALTTTLASALSFEATTWPDMVRQAAKFVRFRDALLSGVFDKEAARYEIFEEREIRPQIDFLRAKRLSLFGTAIYADLGRPIADIGPAAPSSTCTGAGSAEADPAELGNGGVKLSGTGWDLGRNGPVRRILVTGADGTVVGVGSPDRPAGRPKGWIAYARAAPGNILSAYALLGDGRLCRLGEAKVALKSPLS